MLRGIFLFMLLVAFKGYSQSAAPIGRQGQLFVTWGYNRAYYNESDIHFRGEGFDFTLHNVKAEDMPERFDTRTYFNPARLTVPQFNFRIGYYFKSNTALSIGWDHMKYHLVSTQLVEMEGYIDDEKFPDAEYAGVYRHEMVLYTPRLMNYHHSDGFNFLRLALEQRIPFWQSASAKHVLVANAGISAGAMMPWTDFTFLGTHYRNRPHFAGYGASVLAGFRYELMQWLFLQVNAQCGWTNLPDILLQNELPSRAEQKITFLERSWAIGGYIPLRRSEKPAPPVE